MITRRSVLLAVGVGLLVADRLGNAQTAPTIRRVGMLLLPSETAYAHLCTAFAQPCRQRAGFRLLGYPPASVADRPLSGAATVRTGRCETFAVLHNVSDGHGSDLLVGVVQSA